MWTYSFALERLGSDGLDWDPCRHGPPIGWVDVLQDSWGEVEMLII